MAKFRITIIVCLVMALAVPLTNRLAVSENSPAYTHFIYMTGHDGWIHYAINAWSLLVMHNLFRWYRVLSAYALAVLISFVALPEQPMVGASVFTCFFFGFAAPWLWRRERLAVLMTIGLLVLTCILPGFAGMAHAVAFVGGVVFSIGEGIVRDFKGYLG